MSTAAAASAYLNVISSGGSKLQAAMMAGVSFLAEDMTEAIEFSDLQEALKLGQRASSVKEGFKKYMTSRLSEGVNEFFGEAVGEFMESVSEIQIMGAMSSYEQNYQNYLQTMTPEKAKEQAERDFWGQIFTSGALGFVSASMSTAVMFTSELSANRKFQRTFDANPEAFVQNGVFAENAVQQNENSLRQAFEEQSAQQGDMGEFAPGNLVSPATDVSTTQQLMDAVGAMENQGPEEVLQKRTPRAAEIGQALGTVTQGTAGTQTTTEETAPAETTETAAEETAPAETVTEETTPVEQQESPAETAQEEAPAAQTEETAPAEQPNIFMMEDGSNAETAGAAQAEYNSLPEEQQQAVRDAIDVMTQNGIDPAQARTAASHAVLLGGNMLNQLTGLNGGEGRKLTRKFIRDLNKAYTNKNTRRTINRKTNTWMESQTAPEQVQTGTDTTTEAPAQKTPVDLKKNFAGMSDEAFDTEMKTAQGRITVLSGVNGNKTKADSVMLLTASLTTSEENSTNASTAEAKAAAVKLAEELGSDHAASALMGLYLSGLENGITGDEIAKAVRTAALSGDANLLGLFQNFESDVSFNSLYAFINTCEAAAADPATQGTINQQSYNQEVADETQNEVANGALDATIPAQQAQDRAQQADDQATQGLHQAEAEAETSKKKVKQATLDVIENPADNAALKRQSTALEEHSGKQTVVEQMKVHKKKTSQKLTQTKKNTERIANEELGKARKAAKEKVDQRHAAQQAEQQARQEQQQLLEQQQEQQLSAADDMKFGNSTTTYSNGNVPVKVHYAFVSKNGLNISNDAQTGAVNPNFPAELQNRNRASSVSMATVENHGNDLQPAFLVGDAHTSSGAPIITQDGVVIAGNGRTMSIEQAMAKGNDGAKAYTQYLKDHAAEFGLNPADVTDDTILVRVLDTEGNTLSPQEIMEDSNQSNVERIDQGKMAENDAAKLTNDLLAKYDGNSPLTSAKNLEFVNAFLDTVVPQNERGVYLIDTNGKITGFTSDAIKRVTNALVQLAYGSQEITDAYAKETNPDAKAVLNALVNCAGKVASYNNDVRNGQLNDFKISETLSEAFEQYRKYRNDPSFGTIDDFLGQSNFLDENGNINLNMETLSPEVEATVRMFDENIRSGKKINQMINHLVDNAVAWGNPNQTEMDGLGPVTAPSIQEFYQSAYNENAPVVGQQSMRFSGNEAEEVANQQAAELRAARPNMTELEFLHAKEVFLKQAKESIERRNRQEQQRSIPAADEHNTREYQERKQKIQTIFKSAFGLDIIFENAEGKNWNGKWETGTNRFHLNEANLTTRQMVNKVLLHELTHPMEGTKYYQQFQNIMLSYHYGTNLELALEHEKTGTLSKNDENLLKDIRNTIELYKANGEETEFKATETQTVEQLAASELTADLSADLFDSDEKIDALCKQANPGLLRRIANRIGEMIDALRGKGINTDKLKKAKSLFESYMNEHWSEQQKNGETEEERFALASGKKGKYNPFGLANANHVFGPQGYNRIFNREITLNTIAKNDLTAGGDFIGHSASTSPSESDIVYILHGDKNSSVIPRFYAFNNNFAEGKQLADTINKNSIIEAIYEYERTAVREIGGRDVARVLRKAGVALYVWDGSGYHRSVRGQRFGYGQQNYGGYPTVGSEERFSVGTPGVSEQSTDGVRYSLSDSDGFDDSDSGFDDGFDDDFDDDFAGGSGFLDDGGRLMKGQDPSLHGEINEPVRAPFADDGTDSPVDIPESFRNWFSDPSGVLTNQENGKPKVFYSGEQGGMLSTRMDMNAFRQGEGGLELPRSVGKFLTNYHRAADQYADRGRKGRSIDFKPYNITNWETARKAMRDVGLDLVKDGAGYRIVDSDGRKVGADGTSQEAYWYREDQLELFNANYGFNVQNRYGGRKNNATAESLQHGAVYEGFASEENPLTIQANGNHWDKLSLDSITVTDKNGNVIQGLPSNINTTDGWYEWATQNGYDSVNVLNVLDGNYDDNGEEVPMDDIILSNPNQFKSVYNTGEYSTGTEPGAGGALGDYRHQDIRYSLPSDEALMNSMRQGIEQKLDRIEQARNRDASAIHQEAAEVAQNQLRVTNKQQGVIERISNETSQNNPDRGGLTTAATAGHGRIGAAVNNARVGFESIMDNTRPAFELTRVSMEEQQKKIDALKARQAAGEQLTPQEKKIIKMGVQGYESTNDIRDMVLAARNEQYNWMDSILGNGGTMIDMHGKTMRKANGEAYGSFTDLTKGKIKVGEEEAFEQFLLDWSNWDRIVYTGQAAFEGDTRETITARLAETQAMHPEWQGIADEMYDWYRAFFHEYRTKTGLVSQQAEDDMFRTHPHYAPMYRVEDGTVRTGRDRLQPSRKLIEISNMARIAGKSDKGVMNPMVAMQNQIQDYIRDAKQAEVMQAVNRKFSDPNVQKLNIARLVSDTETEAISGTGTNGALDANNAFNWLTEDRNHNTVLNCPNADGTVSSWVCNDDGLIGAILSNVAHPQETYKGLNGIAKVTSAFSALMTAFDPRFFINNYLSDGKTAVMTGDAAGLYAHYVLQSLLTAGDVFVQETKGKLGLEQSETYKNYQLFANLGSPYSSRTTAGARELRNGSFGTFNGIDIRNPGTIAAAPGQILQDKAGQFWRDIHEIGLAGEGLSIVKDTVNAAFSPVVGLSELLETASRYNEFKNGHYDLTTYEGLTKAGKAAREVTVDFSKASDVQIINDLAKFVPFLRSAIQGTNKTIRMFSSENAGRRGQIATRLIINGLLTGMFTAALRKKDWTDEERKGYDESSAYYKMRYYAIKLPGLGMVKFKRSQDVICQTANAFGEFLIDSFNGWEDNDFSQLVDCVKEAAGNIAPSVSTVVSPWIDAYHNVTYTGAEIASSYDFPTGTATADKYNDDTWMGWRNLSKFFNRYDVPVLKEYSPLAWSYAFGQFFGSNGNVIVDALHSEDGLTPKSLLDSYAGTFAERFQFDPVKTAQSFSDFNTNRLMLVGIANSVKQNGTAADLRDDLTPAEITRAARKAESMTGSGGTLQTINSQISGLWKRYNALADNDRIPQDEKEEKLRKIRSQITDASMRGNAIVAAYRKEFCFQSPDEQIANSMFEFFNQFMPKEGGQQ